MKLNIGFLILNALKHGREIELHAIGVLLGDDIALSACYLDA